jgi:hypothetical protein
MKISEEWLLGKRRGGWRRRFDSGGMSRGWGRRFRVHEKGPKGDWQNSSPFLPQERFFPRRLLPEQV